ncbi:MAG: 2Fe-2S iron-sulfur cluster binding domain-containing protein [Comamonas sp.]|uniref:class I ribonucleotide reductase maintenance protein YfaE n=1 Tax=Comamonas sp. TaxID=34028 RepID=UPI0028327119|nr:class I ribonucleotide reductase maintenance protein YfaE [Comamonas sp.]MDR0214116.1 2Fe-2S iron-sulfur cluster binding domain-containing protein [Comamonas sp.]
MITVDTTSKRIEVASGETLLDALERTGHEVAYQCRSGYCGACRLRLLSGKPFYPEEPLACIGASEVLPCCCLVVAPLTVECALLACTPATEDFT